MRAIKQRTAQFDLSADEVYSAALGVVQNGKFILRGAQNESRQLFFTLGLTPLSWGTQYIAEVVASGEGAGATLTVTCGGVDNAPPALIDGWKHGRAADKAITQIRAALDGSAPAPSQSVDSFATLPDNTVVPWPGGPWPGA